MDIDELLGAFLRDGPALATAAERAGLGARVPSCPDWDVADLVYHTGEVVTSWSSVVEQRLQEPPDLDVPRPPDDELLTWYRAALDRTVRVLTDADPATVVWSWAPNGPTAGWVVRRMAQELAVHRWDAEAAASDRPPPVEAGLAADGIDEYLEHFAGWPSASVPDLGGTVHLHCTDVDGEWLVSQPAPGAPIQFTREHAKGDAALRGPASELLLAVWKRRPLEGNDAIEVFGDADVARRFVERTDLS